VCKFCIQIGKTAIAVNFLGYTMDHDPGPIMVCLPGEVSLNKWITQKLSPMLEETPAAQRALSSTASRDSANQRAFKDFAGGQLYIEHAGNPARLKSTTVKKLIVDELDEFATSLRGGDDPVDLLEGRTSSFPTSKKQLDISTPGIKGLSRIDEQYDRSDQRRYYVPCPHCGHEQPFEWSGLKWSENGEQAWYMCRSCAATIDEHHKTAMIAAGYWKPENPGSRIHGYHLNCLYYPVGLGPRWADLVGMWLRAQNDVAKLKTFINDRLAESWEDPAMRAVKHNVIRDRAEAYPLRTAPRDVLEITAGVDTQDNRLAVQIVGWGRGMRAWTLDYDELPGDPAEDEVWILLTDLLNRAIAREDGGIMRVAAAAIDMGGHRTEDVKAYVRRRLIRRPMCIFGAVQNNAPALGKPRLADINWRGQVDKRGVQTYQVGTVAIKHMLYSKLGVDADYKKVDGKLLPKTADDRIIHFSEELPPEFFTGVVSETFNPAKNRFEKRKGSARNEPLDTWVYAYAAANHPELRLHRRSKLDWDQAAMRVGAPAAPPVPQAAPQQNIQVQNVPRETPSAPPAPSRFARRN
ncbi:MAG: phage terminase large subunit family protein, partial [Rudaea sp.]